MIYLGRKDDLVWNAQGTSLTPPDSFANDAFSIPWTCFVNGYFTTIQLFSNYVGTTFQGIQITSYDDVGGVCTYTSRAFFLTDRRMTTFTNAVSTTIYQSGNKFKAVTYLGTFEFVVPNVYVQGAIFEIPVTNPVIPSPPCGPAAFQNAYYVNKYGITAYEWIITHSLTTDYYASFYNNNNFFLGGGYYGNYPNGSTDPVYRVGLNLPPANHYTGPFYKGDGQAFIYNGPYVFQNVGATQLLLQGSPNLLVCGGSGNPAAQIVSGNSWFTYLQTIGAPAFAGTGLEAQSGCCDSSGVYGLGTSYNVNIAGNVCAVCRMYSIDWLQDITCNLFPANYWAATRGIGISYAKKRIYTLYDLSGANGLFRQLKMYSASYTPPSLSTHILSKTENSLVNYHRAISPDGAFQA